MKKNKNNTNKDQVRNKVRQAYEVAIAEELSSGQEETQHSGFMPVFLFIEGDIRDIRNICLN